MKPNARFNDPVLHIAQIPRTPAYRATTKPQQQSDMKSRLHPPMQDPNDGNAIPRRPEVEHVFPNTPPPIPRSDMRAVLPAQRRTRHRSTRRLDQIDLPQRLRQAPLRHTILEHPIEIALRPRRKPILTHAPQLYAA